MLSYIRASDYDASRAQGGIGMSEAIQISTTTATREDAERLAAALVEQRLAACVQVGGPIASCYRWQGAIETAQEWRCTIKTTRAVYEQVERAIRQLHPYDEPEIIAVPIVAGSAGYLRWLEQQVGD
jgi:periplasmic divalent cation tolerance protein